MDSFSNSHQQPASEFSNWIWNNAPCYPPEYDSLTRIFNQAFLPSLKEAFHNNSVTGIGLRPCTAKDLSMNGKFIRVIFVGAQGFNSQSHVFIRNENQDGVHNFDSTLCEDCKAQSGFSTLLPPRIYSGHYGGFMAEIFLFSDKTLLTSGIGTDHFSRYTSPSTIILKHPADAFTYVEIRLGTRIRFAFAIMAD